MDLNLPKTDLVYQSAHGSGVCASYCLGVPGSVSFNWREDGSQSGVCVCYRSVFKLKFIKKIQDSLKLTSKRPLLEPTMSI